MSDLIERQAAIDAIRASTSKYTGFMEMEMYTDDDAVEAIEAVPSASPWHRVDERLPDDSREVIIFTASGITGVGSFIRPNWYQWYSGGGLPVDVTHWMEKPEPPKEEEHGN